MTTSTATAQCNELERQLAIVRAWPDSPMRAKWIRKAEARLAAAKAEQLGSVAAAFTEDEKATHDEEHMALNHRSASALNSSDLRDRILSELRKRTMTLSRLGKAEWENTFELLTAIEAWIRFGKPVVDATLAEMGGKDVELADISQRGFPQSILLKQ